MRLIGRLAVVNGILVLASACSDGAGTPPPDNIAPVANFTVPSCTINAACSFASTSTDDAEVTDWSWDLNGDGTAEATTANASFTYTTAGTYNVSLTVWDAQDLSHTKTSTITIEPAPLGNAAPIAGFDHTCSAADCTFISTSTDAAPGTISTYEWTFGDGGTADVSNPSHSYIIDASTDFTVTLTVTDNEGATAVVTKTITVAPAPTANTPPTASFIHACNAANCTFSSTSIDAAPGTIATYAWTFGDGAVSDVSNPSHGYDVSVPTDFTVALTVTDNEGATAVASKTLTITPVPSGNGPPTADFTHTCNAANCTFVSTSTDVAPGTIATYAWTFGDGATADVKNPSHSYIIDASTDFTVTLTVTDNEGATAIVTKTITVTPVPSANVAPTARFTPWCHGEGCLFINNSTDEAPGTIASYAWTFGDGATETFKKPSHTDSITGRTTFTVTLTVTDNEGATDIESQTLTVSPLPPAVEGCTTSARIVECVLDIPARSTLKLKLLGVACDLKRTPSTSVTVPPPVGDQVFLSVCWLPAGQELGIFGGRNDAAIVYQAGTQARIWITQGVPNKVTDPPLAPPVGQLTGTFPDWTINFEDGDHAGAEGEPDFSDVVLGVHATPR